MNPNIVKILEIKGTDWMKGYSLQSGFQLGGLFQQALGFNPFEKMGYMKPSLSPVQIDAVTITTAIRFLKSFTTGGVPYAFGLGNRAGTGTKCFYRINLNDNTVSDYSSVVYADNPTGAVIGSGLTVYKSRVIYANATGDTIRSNSITPAAAPYPGDTTILSTAGTSSATPTRFHVGSDKILYYTAPNTFSIGKIDTIGSIGGVNSASAFALETGLIPRDITGDGYYEVIISDDNDGQIAGITSRCKVYFWDKYKSTADQIWDIPDDYLIAGRFVNGAVHIIGKSGIWKCNLHTPPKLVYPFPSTDMLPSSPYQVDVQGTILYWAPQTTSLVANFLNVFAYGSLIGKPIVFSPYITTQNANNQHNALCSTGGKFLAATNDPALYLHNSGSTRITSVIKTASEQLGKPFQYAYTKISLKDKLTTGQTLSLTLNNETGDVISNTVVKSYDATRTQKDFKFDPSPGTTITTFEDINALIQPVNGATIERVTVYGIPQEDVNQSED